MEAKEDCKEEGKAEEKGAAPGADIFDKVSEFCQGSGFERDFEEFAAKHKDVFLAACEMKAGDEHSLEYHRIYTEYLQIFEGKIHRFIEESGGSVGEFHKLAAAALQEPDCDVMRKFFIEALLATTEYETFMGLMKNEAKRLRAMPK